MKLIEEIQQVQEQAELLFSKQQIESALDQLASKIHAVLADQNPLVLCVMNGGLITAGQLLTRLQFPLNMDAVNATRYGMATTGSQLQWLLQPATPLSGRVVLIIDDILDQGLTLEAIINWCRTQNARSVYSAVLVNKLISQTKPVSADFIALTVPDRYVFGYGMDYKGYLRNLPGIYACKD